MKNGVIAAGNHETAQAGAEVLRDGGNAFDAAIAALCTSFVCEPVLSSPAGGGFMTAKPQGGPAQVVDFFTDTPLTKRPENELDFHGVDAEFEVATQAFHIGQGSVATPGTVAGLFHIHEKWGALPMARLMEPAIRLARVGHALDPLQARICDVVSGIVMATPGAREVFASKVKTGAPLQAGEQLQNAALADFLTALAAEGPQLFYEGEVADAIVEGAREGGLLTVADLRAYRVIERAPVKTKFADADFYTNPPPSSGGSLVLYALAHLAQSIKGQQNIDEVTWALALLEAMADTSRARHASGFAQDSSASTAERLMAMLSNRAHKAGGTTHLSVSDARGNAVAMTVSNGEGAGHMVPGCGFMLNNMLGEEDIHPNGFFGWTPGTRISSMMSPTVIEAGDGVYALGSGGSNRIRTAIFQVVANLLVRGMGLDEAVERERLHFERGHVSLEAGLSEEVLSAITSTYVDYQIWPERDFFFGGVHIAHHFAGNSNGAADSRRGGVVAFG